jgi:rSAM/selenodomain-associated transferase 2
MRVAIVVPVRNEAGIVPALAARLQPLRAAGAVVLLVDGESGDDTVAQAAAAGLPVWRAPAGRARQMNAGAGRIRDAAGQSDGAARVDDEARQSDGARVGGAARVGTATHSSSLARRGGASAGARAPDGAAEVLLFLHADTVLPPDALAQIAAALATGSCWGRFDVRLSGERPLFRLVETLMNLRSRLTGIATGDQAIFVRRDLFEAVGGFPDIALMEDIALSAALRRRAWPACLRPPVVTSSRRWEAAGAWRTIVIMWALRLAFFFGAAPARLKASYDRLR